jgi:glyoxylase-like metal-dependent hydrolase (beta-lactamase superfamily II)
MYNYSVLVQGFPGTSLTFGALGWSTVALLSKENQNILIDTGGFGMRSLIINKLKAINLQPTDISTLLITHTHWDHMMNYTLFPNADILIGKADLEWALTQPAGDSYTAQIYVKELSLSPHLRSIEDQEEVLPGITVYSVPGHTPGHLAFLVDNGDKDLIFVGDAGKNRAEFISRTVTMTMNEAASQSSLARLWKLWRRKQGTIMIPGHDIPMILQDGTPTYIEKRRAEIQAWFKDNITEKKDFPLE